MGATDLKDRWKTLQLLSPVFEVINRSAPRANIDHHQYDLAQLSLRLIDYVVHNQASLEGAVSLESLMDHLTQSARKMNPDDPDRPYAKVASIVFKGLFNDGRPHTVNWLDADASDGRVHDDLFRFRLLRMIDSEGGAALAATDEAILLYLRALDTDLADQALALKLMVEIQMQAGEFDKALETAKQATRTAQGLSASLRERLTDTKRDIRAVDWDGAMPSWLKEVQGKIRQQLDRDRQLLDLARSSGDDPEAQDACQAIAAEVMTGQQVWTALEIHLQAAIPTFLKAQAMQRFNPRGLAAMIDMTRDVLDPALAAPEPVFLGGVDVLIQGIGAPPVPVAWGLGELTDALFKPPTRYDRKPPDFDDPGELVDVAPDSLPEDVTRSALAVLGAAVQEPIRLSGLITAARRDADAVEDAALLQDVIWASALWLFVEGSASTVGGDDETTHPARGDLGSLLARLTVVVDDKNLADERYQGPDLTVAQSVMLDILDKEEAAAQ
jgi:tetratricopeptide (TPR) repeat protein